MFDRVDLPKANVRGEVTVRLFDATTKSVISEVKAENKINNYYLQLLRLYQREMFLRKITSSINKAAYDYLVAGPHIIRLISGQFATGQENTRFFDLDGRVDVLDKAYSYEFLKTVGETVGYSFMDTYAGSDTKRGGLNLGESYVSNTRIHLVFDFPTHAANGTFSAVGTWIDLFSNASIPLFDIVDTQFKFSPAPPAQGKGLFNIADDRQTGDTYALYVNGLNVNYSRYFELYKFSLDGTYTKVADIDFGNLYYKENVKMTVINGVVFTATSNNVFKVMNGAATKYSNSNFGYFNKGFGSVGGYIYGLKDSKTIIKVDPAGMSVVEEINTGTFDTRLSGGVNTAIFNDMLSYMAINSNPKLFVIDLSARRLLSAFDAHNKLIETNLDGKSVYRGIPVFVPYDSAHVVYNILEPFSFVNLPAQVTKTSAQTLKVEYDFIFEF